MRQYKCDICGEMFVKHKMAQQKNKRYRCLECVAKIEIDLEHRNALYEYIKTSFQIEFPTGGMLKTIKELIGKGCTYNGIMYTIYYISLIGKLDKKKLTLGLVEYYYQEAKEYFDKVNNATLSAQASRDIKVNIVTINKIQHKPYVSKKMVDIDSL